MSELEEKWSVIQHTHFASPQKLQQLSHNQRIAKIQATNIFMNEIAKHLPIAMKLSQYTIYREQSLTLRHYTFGTVCPLRNNVVGDIYLLHTYQNIDLYFSCGKSQRPEGKTKPVTLIEFGSLIASLFIPEIRALQ